MARIRYVKPEFFEDERIGRLSHGARLIFIGLWTLMDRNGLTDATTAVIRSRLFPYDDLRTKDVEALLNEVMLTSRVKRIELSGRNFLYCPTLRKHQHFHRDEKPKYPLSKEDLEALDQHGASMVQTQFNAVASTPGNGELVTENGERRTRHRAKPGFDFDAFWKVFPRKIAKIEARARFDALIGCQEDFDALLVAVAKFRAHHEAKGTEERYIPYPATFLGTKSVPTWKNWLDDENGKCDIAGGFVGLKLDDDEVRP